MESVNSFHARKPAHLAPRTIVPAELLRERSSKTKRGSGSTARVFICALSSVLMFPLVASSQIGTMPLASTAIAHAQSLHSPPRIDKVLHEPPWAFEANKGQFDPTVAFLARGTGQRVFLTADGMHLVLDKAGPRDSELTQSVVRLRFEGASTKAAFVGLERLAGITNYFRGKTRIRNIENYAKVRQLDVYAGIDTIYYGSKGQLEYDFVVSPGGKVDRIKLRLSGHDDAYVAEAGDLVLATPAGNVTLHKPVAYQEENATRIDVPVRFLLAGNQVQFEVGAYDPARPLVIDPILSYSTYVTGSSDNRAGAIVVDVNGNAYITGETNSTDFPRLGPYQNSRKGYRDAFVTKLNADGSGLVYSTYIGGRKGDTSGKGIAIDAAGSAYITGTTTSPSYPTTSGAYRTTIGANSGFVTKLNPQGNAIDYSTYIVGGEGASVVVDSQGSAYIAGTAYNGFATSPGAFQPTPSSTQNGFVAKLNPTGSGMVYASFLGGSSGNQFAAGIAIDGAGHAYVAGWTSAGDFPVVNPYQASLKGTYDGFVAKVNPDGTALVYSTYLGGSLDDYAYAIAVDANGNAHVAGSTYSADFPVLRAFQSSKAYTGSGQQYLNNAFVSKLSATGESLVFSSYLGGSGCLGPGVYSCSLIGGTQDSALAIALDAAGNAYLAGSARSLAFNQTDPLRSDLSPYGNSTPFIAKVQDLASGNAVLAYSTSIGQRDNSLSDMAATGIAVDGTGNAYAVAHVGNYPEGGFPITPGAFQASTAQYSNVARTVVFKLSPGRFTTSLVASNFQPNSATPVTLTATVGSAIPGGAVTFTNRGVPIGVAPMARGQASLSASLPAGVHELVATYSGDNKASPPLYLPVSQAPICN